MPWYICDSVRVRCYVPLRFATQEDAEFFRADLLAPYPAGHKWRKRLVVVETSQDEPGTRIWTREQPTESDADAANARIDALAIARNMARMHGVEQ